MNLFVSMNSCSDDAFSLPMISIEVKLNIIQRCDAHTFLRMLFFFLDTTITNADNRTMVFDFFRLDGCMMKFRDRNHRMNFNNLNFNIKMGNTFYDDEPVESYV